MEADRCCAESSISSSSNDPAPDRTTVDKQPFTTSYGSSDMGPSQISSEPLQLMGGVREGVSVTSEILNDLCEISSSPEEDTPLHSAPELAAATKCFEKETQTCDLPSVEQTEVSPKSCLHPPGLHRKVQRRGPRSLDGCLRCDRLEMENAKLHEEASKLRAKICELDELNAQMHEQLRASWGKDVTSPQVPVCISHGSETKSQGVSHAADARDLVVSVGGTAEEASVLRGDEREEVIRLRKEVSGLVTQLAAREESGDLGLFTKVHEVRHWLHVRGGGVSRDPVAEGELEHLKEQLERLSSALRESRDHEHVFRSRSHSTCWSSDSDDLSDEYEDEYEATCPGPFGRPVGEYYRPRVEGHAHVASTASSTTSHHHQSQGDTSRPRHRPSGQGRPTESTPSATCPLPPSPQWSSFVNVNDEEALMPMTFAPILPSSLLSPAPNTTLTPVPLSPFHRYHHPPTLPNSPPVHPLSHTTTTTTTTTTVIAPAPAKPGTTSRGATWPMGLTSRGMTSPAERPVVATESRGVGWRRFFRRVVPSTGIHRLTDREFPGGRAMDGAKGGPGAVMAGFDSSDGVFEEVPII